MRALNGKPALSHDVALLNTAAALIVAGRAKDLKEGVAIGARSIRAARQRPRLKHLIGLSCG